MTYMKVNMIFSVDSILVFSDRERDGIKRLFTFHFYFYFYFNFTNDNKKQLITSYRCVYKGKPCNN